MATLPSLVFSPRSCFQRSDCWPWSLVLALSLITWSALAAPKVQLLRPPEGGIQPQAAMDERGTLHLVYLKGDPKATDVFYVRQPAGRDTFSARLRVNRQRGSAMAIGTIRGPHLALGKNGRVHVAWNGSTVSDKHAGVPMLYTRLNAAGTAFEPERDLITQAAGLDGGGSVAADPAGNVYVLWHALKPGSTEGEGNRAVFVARSTDDGRTFAREKLATAEPTGACGCCGMRAFADHAGTVFALYRAAGEKVNRDETLLISRNQGLDFAIANAHPWKISTCPMSSAFFSESGSGVLAAWETEGNVFFARVDPKTQSVSPAVSPASAPRAKHPAVAGNARGEVLLAWTEGTGWQRGGTLAWQMFGPEGRPIGEINRAEGVPVWSLVSAVARPDGSFLVLY